MRFKLICLTAGALLAILAGCQSSGPTQKEQAVQNWNAARANVMLGLASDQFHSGNFDKSRTTVNDALKLDPKNPAIHILSAQLAIEQGQLDVADQELAVARSLNPKDPQADYLSGVVYQRWGQTQKALDFYSAACALSPDTLEYVMAKAEMLESLNKPAEALALLQSRVAFFEHSAAIRDEIGLLLEQQGQLDAAVDMHRQATLLESDDLTFREHLASAEFRDGQYGDAADSINRLMADAKYQKRTDLFLMLGECQLQIGRAAEARGTFQAASALDPSSVSALLGEAKAEVAVDDNGRADVTIRRAAALGAAESDIDLLRGYLRLRENRLDEALASFRRASQLHQSDPICLCMEGYVFQKQGRTADASRCYAEALRISPGDDMARRLLAGLNDHD
jgi:Tfp pilus assembly protein PilF